jgi:hypothetical protein
MSYVADAEEAGIIFSVYSELTRTCLETEIWVCDLEQFSSSEEGPVTPLS